MPPAPRAGRSILLALAALAVSVPACAPTPTGDAGLVARIDSMAQAEVGSNTTASLAIGVMRGADIVLARGYGQADMEAGRSCNSRDCVSHRLDHQAVHISHDHAARRTGTNQPR